jgi:glycosyltransferase involved in cell wall biosynthesis
MHLSVVIGTYNRAHLLAGTLGALAAQEAPPSLDWEIVVVDNNSTDSTAQAVAAFVPTTTVPVRYVFEPRQGISHARNRGIREAQGSILAFTDDDVLPAPDWVSCVAAAMERWDAQGVGGRILPRWETEVPRWLAENRRPSRLLALMDYAQSAMLKLPLERQPQVWGANMAFRRSLFDRVGEFDPRRGIVGRRLLRGEESDLIERALNLGLKIAYDPTLTVFHRIGPDRTRKAYFRRLEFESARGEARLRPAGPGPSFLGAPLARYRDAVTDLGRWAGLAFSGRRRFDRELRCWSSLGSLSGHW